MRNLLLNILYVPFPAPAVFAAQTFMAILAFHTFRAGPPRKRNYHIRLQLEGSARKVAAGRAPFPRRAPPLPCPETSDPNSGAPVHGRPSRPLLCRFRPGQVSTSPRDNSSWNRSRLLRRAREPLARPPFFPSAQSTNIRPGRQLTSTLAQEERNTLFTGRDGVGQKRNPLRRRAPEATQPSEQSSIA